MSIIETLKKRSENPSDEVKIELKLYNLADDLEKKARNHLKRISSILPEFDIHDEKHSEKVILNIEQLLGDDKIKQLSSYELFLLHLSAFFHDCALAPPDWELNLLNMTEGTKKFAINENSLRNDLNTPLKLSSAIELVKERKRDLYGEFKDDVRNWMFSPKNEDELIEYLASLLIDYQNFRNGFADQIKKIINQPEFESLNNFIRINFIRVTHHTRIETYIKNLEPTFSNSFEQPSWGKELARDLASICKSHGEDVSFINDFSNNAQYYGNESANLQFISMMLRLGDIIHFSFDRAPIDLRSSRLFKSEYSFQQWAIKHTGVNYTIENGKISFRAYCETPDVYFKLHQYIDWIEIEIQNYFKLERIWNESYIENLQDKVDRGNITNDIDTFLPKRGLSFSLNQKRIIELLMGVGLYKDKFACLRELYQNSLDACKCMLYQNNLIKKSSTGLIEFSIQKEKEKTFLCCTDNGIGMTKNIIEKYLLNIGNSYYKSSDFYKLQAKWGGTFTPTSQFGIGILSCFMIGDKIEITTKSNNDDYISCSIEGPHENFYYKKTSEIDKEKISNTGTIIKVLLNDKTKNKLVCSNIEKLGLLLLSRDDYLPEEYLSYKKFFNNWKNHLYNKINSFIGVISNDIEVNVQLENKMTLKIENKPILLKINKLGITNQDIEFMDFLNNQNRIHPFKQKYSDIKEFLEIYEIEFTHKTIQYKTTLTLPKAGLIITDSLPLYSVPKIDGSAICIDGIKSNSISFEYYYSFSLMSSGILNFTGEIRPQLSVDRTSIIDYPSECECIAKEVVVLLLKKILDITKKHIARNHIKNNSSEFNLIWDYIFEKIGFADNIFINELSLTEYGEIYWEKLNNAIGEKITIRDFLSRNIIKVNNYNLSHLDILSKKLILFKLLSAKRIITTDDSITIESAGLFKTNLLRKRNEDSDTNLLIKADEWNISFSDYDIISNLYPIIPDRLFDVINKGYIKQVNERVKQIHSFSNGITAFFKQNPFLINETLGLYFSEKDPYSREKDLIYNFEKKRAKIHLFELNEMFSKNKSKVKYVLTVYISPKELTYDENQELQKIQDKDPSYFKGVKEGWSLLATGMNKNNIIIIPGKHSRNELVCKLPDSFWTEYKDFTFKFTDNTIMKKQKSSH